MKGQVFSLEDLIKGTQGKLLYKGDAEFSGVSTDSRKGNTGKIFFALKGENYDAHQFVSQAVKDGATAVVIHEPPHALGFNLSENGITLIQVDDTLKALQKMGGYWRRKMKAKVVAITGSNGKTTTKEFSAVLCSQKYSVQYSKGSFNNHFGVPLSLLELRPEHQVGIFELGMNHAGELTELTKIADPDVTVVTTVGSAHIEFFGSQDAIAKAKEELYMTAKTSAVRIFNLDNSFTLSMRGRYSESTQLSFSAFDPKATVHLKEVVSKLDFMEVTGTIGGEPGQAKVPLFGRQNIYNLMAASCVALACDVEPDLIWQGLPKCKTTWGRNQLLRLSNGTRVIFDAYNANPESMTALMENVSRLNISGRKFIIVGEMLAMGDQSGKLHEDLGRLVGEGQFDFVWFVGSKGEDFSRGLRSTGFSKKIEITSSYDESLALKVLSMLQPSDIVLLKGSRGMKLEKIVHSWGPADFGSKD